MVGKGATRKGWEGIEKIPLVDHWGGGAEKRKYRKRFVAKKLKGEKVIRKNLRGYPA